MSKPGGSAAERRKRSAAGRGGGARRREREVLEAAAKVFHRHSYADASVKDIADELGILKGSLYHYISSKEDLLFWLLDETHDDVQAILDEVAAAGLQPLDALREYVRRQVDYTSRNLARMAIYYHDADLLSAERSRELVAKRRKHEAYVTALIEAAQADGSAAPGTDPRLVANFVFGSMIWVYRWHKPSAKTPAADVASMCADFVINGVIGGQGA